MSTGELDLARDATLTARDAPSRRLGDSRVQRLAWPRREILAFSTLAAGIAAFTYGPAIAQALYARAHGELFLGITGIWPMDQLQYLAWARDAGTHGLIANLYGAGGKHVLLHPLWTTLGWLQAELRLSPAATMLLAQTIGFAALLGGWSWFVCTRLRGASLARRVIAVTLAVFGGLTPLVVALHTMAPELGSTYYRDLSGALLASTALWAYAPLAVALGLMPIAITRLEPILTTTRTDWFVLPLLGGLISWLHPWQGEELLIIGGMLTLWGRGDSGGPSWSTVRRLSPGAIGTALPLLYYLALSHLDGGWHTSAQNSVDASLIPSAVWATCLAPLGLVVILAMRTGTTHQHRSVLVWPPAVLLVALLTPTGQYRALAGLSLPVSILAVGAWPEIPRASRRRLAAAFALGAAIVPTIPFAVSTLRSMNAGRNGMYTSISADDLRAADVAVLAARGTPILAPVEFATAVPAVADGRVWAGHPIWTPNHLWREGRLWALFNGAMTPVQMRSLITAARARVLVQPCNEGFGLASVLRRLGFRARRVGCALVFVRV